MCGGFYCWCFRGASGSLIGNGRAPLRADVLLRGLRFACPPFLRRKKAHARAETFVVTRGLARILERRMNAGSVPASANLACKFGRNVNSAAAPSNRRSCVL